MVLSKKSSGLPTGFRRTIAMHSSTLHVAVSTRLIVLADAHFVPLFDASAILSLLNEIMNCHGENDFCFLIELFAPCPVLDASTAWKRARRPGSPWPDITVDWTQVNINPFWSFFQKPNHTRRAANHIASVCLCELNYPDAELCTLLTIMLGIREDCPEKKIKNN